MPPEASLWRKAISLAFPLMLGIATLHCDQTVGFQGQTESLFASFPIWSAPLLRTDSSAGPSLPVCAGLPPPMGILREAPSWEPLSRLNIHRGVGSKGLPVSWDVD